MLLGGSKLSVILLLLLSLYESIFLLVLIRHVSLLHTFFMLLFYPSFISHSKKPTESPRDSLACRISGDPTQLL